MSNEPKMMKVRVRVVGVAEVVVPAGLVRNAEHELAQTMSRRVNMSVPLAVGTANVSVRYDGAL